MRSTNGTWSTFAVLTVLLLACDALTAPAPEDPDRVAMRESAKQWKEMFNKDIDFDEIGLQQCMVYVYPQPEKAFQDLDDKKYAPWLLDDSAYWTGQFFRKPYRPDVRKDQPEKYYLPKRREETGLLLHEWRTPKYAFTAQESGAGVLVRIVPKGYDPTKPVTSGALADLLFDVFDLQYESADKLAAAFKLPKTLPAGTTFTNARVLHDVVFLADWRRHIVGFVGDDGIYVICYKANPGRMAAVFDYQRDWLNRGLLEKDGKTLVAPPPKPDAEKP